VTMVTICQMMSTNSTEYVHFGAQISAVCI